MSEAEDVAVCCAKRGTDAKRPPLLSCALLVTGALLSGGSLCLGASQWPGVALCLFAVVVVALCHYEGVISGILSRRIDGDDVSMRRIHDEVATLKQKQDETAARVDVLNLRRM